jgi:U3 small nucleolar RNA-associated protein 13
MFAHLDVDDLLHHYREQDFLNYLSLNDYRKAIQLALAMEQPGRLLSLFTDIRSSFSLAESEEPSEITCVPSITGHLSVDEVIRTLPGSDLAQLLRYVRDWNAKAKTSGVAQSVLYAVVKLRSAEHVMQAFGDAAGQSMIVDGLTVGAGGTGLKELVDALIPYTERHLSRMERLVQESYVVDYILGEMDDGIFDGELGDNESSMDVDTSIAIQV